MIPTLRDYQTGLVTAVNYAWDEGFNRPLMVLSTGGGKCLAKGTPVLMFDGTTRPVEDVVVGDKLMGPDSLPRVVRSTTRGREEMFQVTPKKGDPYTVNKSHILSFKMTKGLKHNVYCSGVAYTGGDIANVTVEDYLNSSKTFKHCAKGWRVGVDFPKIPTPDILPPYLLGLWLGDGTARRPDFTWQDRELTDYLYAYAESQGLNVTISVHLDRCLTYRIGSGIGPHKNPLLDALRDLNLIQNKHVPHDYKVTDRESRLQLLAGILDTDGCVHRSGYDFISKGRPLAEDVVFLARSLGLAAYLSPCRKTCCNNGVIGDYYRVSISGNASEIPCRVPRKIAPARRHKKDVTRFSVEVQSAGVGDYYGFEIDGDRLFLLGDFTVTHNTVCFSHITRNFPGRVHVIAHRQELLNQASRTLTDFGVSHGRIQAGHAYDPRHRVHVASIQTLVRRLKTVTPPDLLITDEGHHCTSKSYKTTLDAFPDARVLGVTATPCRLNGQGLGEVFDYMVLGPSAAELTELGALCPAKYYAPPPKADLSGVHVTRGDYATDELEAILDVNRVTGDAVEHYTRMAAGKPALVFCVSVAHAHHVAEQYRAAGYRAASVDGKLSDDDREDRITGLGTGKYQVITSCDLIGEGLDVPSVSVVQMLRPTQSLGLYLQMIGRGLRPSPDGDHLTVLDHVGNCLRHGFAATEREWTLEGKKRNKGDKPPPVRTCESCFSVHKTSKECPYCKYVYPIKVRSLTSKKLIDGVLVEIEQTKEERQAEVREANSLEELTAIAKARGYKKPHWWSLQVWKNRRPRVSAMPRLS